jgi:hypothetical protein
MAPPDSARSAQFWWRSQHATRFQKGEAVVSVEAVLPDMIGLDALEEGFRIRRIRDRLLRPTLEERVAQVRTRYGRVYTPAQLRAATSPRQPNRLRGFERGFLEPLETYGAPISDDALLRFDDALGTESFSQFWVVAPARSGRDRCTRWIVGQLRGGVDLFAIIARWRTETGSARKPSHTKGAFR